MRASELRLLARSLTRSVRLKEQVDRCSCSVAFSSYERLPVCEGVCVCVCLCMCADVFVYCSLLNETLSIREPNANQRRAKRTRSESFAIDREASYNEPAYVRVYVETSVAALRARWLVLLTC